MLPTRRSKGCASSRWQQVDCCETDGKEEKQRGSLSQLSSSSLVMSGSVVRAHSSALVFARFAGGMVARAREVGRVARSGRVSVSSPLVGSCFCTICRRDGGAGPKVLDVGRTLAGITPQQ